MNTIVELNEKELEIINGGVNEFVLVTVTALVGCAYFMVTEAVGIAYVSGECDDWQEKKWSSKAMCYTGHSFYEGFVHGSGHFIPGMFIGYLLGVQAGEGHGHPD